MVDSGPSKRTSGYRCQEGAAPAVVGSSPCRGMACPHPWGSSSPPTAAGTILWHVFCPACCCLGTQYPPSPLEGGVNPTAQPGIRDPDFRVDPPQPVPTCAHQRAPQLAPNPVPAHRFRTPHPLPGGDRVPGVICVCPAVWHWPPDPSHVPLSPKAARGRTVAVPVRASARGLFAQRWLGSAGASATTGGTCGSRSSCTHACVLLGPGEPRSGAQRGGFLTCYPDPNLPLPPVWTHSLVFYPCIYVQVLLHSNRTVMGWGC